MHRTVPKAPHARKARALNFLGWLVMALTLVLVPVTAFVIGPAAKGAGEAFVFGLMLWIALAAMTFGFLQYRSRQYASLARAEAHSSDRRAPVLYLRSFAQDATSIKGAFALQQTLGLHGTFEEQLYEAFAPIGPLIAVGVPGQSLPTPGAHRVYADADLWQDKVEALMRSASLVVILVGKGGAGLGWEIERAFATVERSRLLLLVKRGRRQYEKDRKIVERGAGLVLPAYRRLSRGLVGLAIAVKSANCFLAFSARGDVEVLRIRAPWFRGTGSFIPETRYALKPVYQRLGVPWTPPPLSKANIFVTVVATAYLLMIVFW
jgi:hypothetical protein